MSDERTGRIHDRWAWLRHSIIGPLLAAPPARGELHGALEALAKKTWRHPISGQPFHVAVPTIERWYYAARNANDPVGVLRKKIRSDLGRHIAMSDPLSRALAAQYKDHPRWSYKLHADNLGALVRKDATLGPMPSYPTVRRYMQSHGMFRRRRLAHGDRPNVAHTETRLAQREMRSYEVEHVHALWHADFHLCKRPVIAPSGERIYPKLFGALDDHSRLCCHVQWYLTDGAEEFVHGISQAIQKRGVPRKLLTDNGSGMIAAETTEGLRTLGVEPDNTLRQCPEQNGKQENFWTQIEGRLMPMLENYAELTLALLNEATQAWVEGDYNAVPHGEIGTTPLDRFVHAPNVGRDSPSSDALRRAFRMEVTRTQRRSDGTFTLDGVRYEVPSRFRHVRLLHIQYARWDLSFVDLIDARTKVVLAPVFPIDKAKNADGRRRVLEPIASGAPEVDATPPRTDEIAPRLRELMEQYAATGLPPAYVPKPTRPMPPPDTTDEEKKR
jgi:transposase InsO family protein